LITGASEIVGDLPSQKDLRFGLNDEIDIIRRYLEKNSELIDETKEIKPDPKVEAGVMRKLERQSNLDKFNSIQNLLKSPLEKPPEIDFTNGLTGYNFTLVDSYYINNGAERHYDLKGTCYDIGFVAAFNINVKTKQIGKLEVRVQWQFEKYLNNFINSVCESKSLNHFFERFSSFSYAVHDRNKLYKELKAKYEDSLIVTNYQWDEVIYIKPKKRIFYLVFEWKISIDMNGQIVQTYNCTPIASHQHILKNSNFIRKKYLIYLQFGVRLKV